MESHEKQLSAMISDLHAVEDDAVVLANAIAISLRDKRVFSIVVFGEFELHEVHDSFMAAQEHGHGGARRVWGPTVVALTVFKAARHPLPRSKILPHTFTSLLCHIH